MLASEEQAAEKLKHSKTMSSPTEYDGEEQLVDSELVGPGDAELAGELAMVDRMAKREIRRIEAEVTKWQIVVEQVVVGPGEVRPPVQLL